MSKIKMCKEIIEAMIFLGIPTTDFAAMKQQAGGIEKLYKIMERQIAGK